MLKVQANRTDRASLKMKSSLSLYNLTKRTSKYFLESFLTKTKKLEYMHSSFKITCICNILLISMKGKCLCSRS